MRACGLEDLLRTILLVIVVRMHRDKVIARPKLLFVALGFKFRDPHSNESADDSARGCADSCSAECRHDWAGRDEWPHPRDGKCADACEQAEHAAGESAGSCTGGCALRRLARF